MKWINAREKCEVTKIKIIRPRSIFNKKQNIKQEMCLKISWSLFSRNDEILHTAALDCLTNYLLINVLFFPSFSTFKT